MPFALLVSLLLLISTAVLLYQFWTGALAPADDAEAAAAPPRRIAQRDERTVATQPPQRHYRADSAA